MRVRMIVATIAAVVFLASTRADSAFADSSTSGGSDPANGSIDAGVYHYFGRWSGRRSSCAWELYFGDSLLDRIDDHAPVRKVVGGVEYRLFTKSCPGRNPTVVWVGPPSARTLVGDSFDDLIARLPKPAHRSAPRPDSAYVQTPTWIWTTTPWSESSITAWVPTETNATVWATTTAVPVRLRFDPGDGTPEITCDGPGVPWTDDTDSAAVPSCGHVFRHTSLTAEDGTVFRASLSIDWDVSWTSSTGDGGPLAPVTTSTNVGYRVGEIQAVVER